MSAMNHDTAVLGLGDAGRMFLDPGVAFHRIAERGTYGWTLGALLLITTLFGWVTVQSGLIDREVERQTRREMADLEREQADVISRSELSEQLGKLREKAEFMKLILRGSAVAAAPVKLAASLMLIAAVLFAAVALTGNKPDYATLMAVCVYSAVVEVLAAGLRLAMQMHYRSLDVQASLGVLVPPGEEHKVLHAVLSAVDPFQVWFWVLVAMGLVVCGQLSRRAAVVSCTLLWLVSAGLRMVPATGAWAG